MAGSFSEIEAAARARHGDGFDGRLVVPATPEALRGVPDDRFLSQISLRVFRAGLKHEMVDAKWPAFEEVFCGFHPHRVAAMPDEALEALMGDARLIRHWGKIKALRDNAAAMKQVIAEFGSMGAYLADWPAEEIVGLWDDLSKRFSQLGGNSGPYFLRMVGKDSFICTDFVMRALAQWGVHDGKATGKANRKRLQELFNGWAAESGRPLCQISQILAMSVD